MARLFGFVGNRADLGASVLDLERDLRALERGIGLADQAAERRLVEGITDRLALEAVASRLDLDLSGVEIVPIGGAQAVVPLVGPVLLGSLIVIGLWTFVPAWLINVSVPTRNDWKSPGSSRFATLG